ncbi:MAG: hypothetical protein ACYTGH_07120, partial [Planctomycetota bacterium]
MSRFVRQLLLSLTLSLGFIPHDGLFSAEPIRFPPHPRILYTPKELTAWKADPSRAKEHSAILSRAEKLLKEELYVPTKGGQWIFYYAHPKTGARLEAKSLTEHYCPSTKTWHNDERT